MSMLKIGMIGMSPGNAHPYSWSAIINGVFDSNEIIKRGYPAVARYLEANADTLGLHHAKVTHVWTQEKAISESIAVSSAIEHVMGSLNEMAKHVDAVILARDDAAEHVNMSKVFLDAGIPVFIDKPLANNRDDLDWFSEQNDRGRFLMSCSSMRYSNECKTAKTELKSIGKIELVTSVGKKDWIKYGIHLLEGIFALLDDPRAISVRHIGKKDKDIVHIVFDDGVEATMHLFMNISSTFQISMFGQAGWKLIDIKNSYSMFRDTIIEFVRSVEEGKCRIPYHKTQNIIDTLISADESLNKGGTTIQLKY